MAGQHDNIKGLPVGKFTNDFIPPVVSVSPFDTMKASWQGGSFPVTLKLIFVCPAIKVCGVFNKRVYLAMVGNQGQ